MHAAAITRDELSWPVDRLPAIPSYELSSMWAAEHSVETGATPEAIWRQWADVDRGPEGNGDIERIELDGPFAAGSRITMTPDGQDPVELRIADAVEPTLFVDEADLGEIVVRTSHRAESLAEDGPESPTGWRSRAWRGDARAPDRTGDQRRLRLPPAGALRGREDGGRRRAPRALQGM